MDKFLLKKCNKCGAIIEVINDCKCDNCGIKCCGENMIDIKSNSVDASFEKHLPQYEVVGNYIIVTVPHIMEDDHYIESIVFSSTDIVAKKNLKPHNEAKAIFPYIKNSQIYAYCNLHGLWQTTVE